MLFRYTGHDLLNPSCWANGKWAPTVLFSVPKCQVVSLIREIGRILRRRFDPRRMDHPSEVL